MAHKEPSDNLSNEMSQITTNGYQQQLAIPFHARVYTTASYYTMPQRQQTTYSRYNYNQFHATSHARTQTPPLNSSCRNLLPYARIPSLASKPATTASRQCFYYQHVHTVRPQRRARVCVIPVQISCHEHKTTRKGKHEMLPNRTAK